MKWQECLSHQIWPAIKKGWVETHKEVFFFWGLGDKNISKINECMKKEQEWWYVDVGYLGTPIQKYPPKILDLDNTYFRIVKGGHHITFKKDKLKNYKKFRSLNHIPNVSSLRTYGDYILLCPSSPTVTRRFSHMSYEKWIETTTEMLKKRFDNFPIVVREKPRPGNKFWGTDIKKDLEGAYLCVTNMSLCAVDSLINGVQVVCDNRNVASVLGNDITTIHKNFVLKDVKKEDVEDWCSAIYNFQFTLKEIENGTVYETLKENYGN